MQRHRKNGLLWLHTMCSVPSLRKSILGNEASRDAPLRCKSAGDAKNRSQPSPICTEPRPFFVEPAPSCIEHPFPRKSKGHRVLSDRRSTLSDHRCTLSNDHLMQSHRKLMKSHGDGDLSLRSATPESHCLIYRNVYVREKENNNLTPRKADPAAAGKVGGAKTKIQAGESKSRS